MTRLRWPLSISRCEDCGARHFDWQKPWYTPWIPGPTDELIGSLWNRAVYAQMIRLPELEELTYSKGAIIHIPRVSSVRDGDMSTSTDSIWTSSGTGQHDD